MKKIMILTALVLSSSVSRADIIACIFTEPFVSTRYSTTQSTFTIRDEVMETEKTIKHVSFQIKGPGEFELVDSKGEVLQKLNLNFRGSDDMSENVYPYEAKDTSKIGYAHNYFGGCSSNFLKTKIVN